MIDEIGKQVGLDIIDISIPVVAKSDRDKNWKVLDRSAQVLEVHILDNITEDQLNSDDGPESVAHLVSIFLPMPSGRGNDTILNQLQFIVDNEQLLRSFIQGIPRASEILSEREEVIERQGDTKRKLQETGSFILSARKKGGIYSAMKLLAQTEEWLLKHRKFKQEDKLSKTEDEYQSSKGLREKLSNQFDCKGLAVILGKVFETRGWNIRFLVIEYPEHPTVLLSRGERIYMIDFNSSGPYYQSKVNVKRIVDHRVVERSISLGRVNAIKKGFITEDSEWPLSLNQDSFEKFDTWFIENVKGNKE